MNWRSEALADRIIVALDCSPARAISLGEQLAGLARWVKVGMTLYYAAGPAIVRQLHALGYSVFVDLKLHDIPHQVQGAARSLAEAGADLMTVHASGGSAMLQAAMAGAREPHERCADVAVPAVCAITVLTSMDEAQLASLGIDATPAQHVARLAALSRDAGADGVVCSPREAADMRALLGPDALVVTPGVRPPGSDAGDQSRIATPAEAFAAGASHLVIGRPITQAASPRSAFECVCATLEDGAGSAAADVSRT